MADDFEAGKRQIARFLDGMVEKEVRRRLDAVDDTRGLPVLEGPDVLNELAAARSLYDAIQDLQQVLKEDVMDDPESRVALSHLDTRIKEYETMRERTAVRAFSRVNAMAPTPAQDVTPPPRRRPFVPGRGPDPRKVQPR